MTPYEPFYQKAEATKVMRWNNDSNEANNSEVERPPEWHTQDWLLLLDALERYICEPDITAGQELRACELVTTIARGHGISPLGAVRYLNVEHFEQYAHQEHEDDGDDGDCNGGNGSESTPWSVAYRN